jgi:hypothetical protein
MVWVVFGRFGDEHWALGTPDWYQATLNRQKAVVEVAPHCSANNLLERHLLVQTATKLQKR